MRNRAHLIAESFLRCPEVAATSSLDPKPMSATGLPKAPVVSAVDALSQDQFGWPSQSVRRGFLGRLPNRPAEQHGSWRGPRWGAPFTMLNAAEIRTNDI